MGKENNEIKKAYDELLKTKNKCGKYSKTLFHIHTPVSHDYRLFKVWNDLSEKEWNKLSVEDYLLEVKNNKLFPEEYFKTKDGDSIIYNNYQKNDFENEKEQISFLVVAQSLYRENISTIVVSDHNTISGIKKMEKAIKIVSELNINKGKEYIEVINGVEISCADRIHVLVAFPNEKSEIIKKWLEENLMGIKEGSYKASLDVIDTFNKEEFITYIAHINSSDIFKDGKLFTNAYKKKLFSKEYLKYIGVSNKDSISNVRNYISKINKGVNPFFILDNDSHYIENHSINPMWIKFSKRSYKQLKESLSEYDVTVKLDKPNKKIKKVIRGIYLPTNKEAFLSSNKKFKILFSDSLNSIIGGRGTGKSTILELIQFVLSQKADSKQKLEFLSKHSKVYLWYEMFEKQYIIELNLPKQKENENIYDLYQVRTKSTDKYWFHENRIKSKIIENHLLIYEILDDEKIIKVPKRKKESLLNEMFDSRYSVNELVNSASSGKIDDFLRGTLFKDRKNKKYIFSEKIDKIEKIIPAIESADEKLSKQYNFINSIIDNFNNQQTGNLQIVYKQELKYLLPDHFETWFFPPGKNLKRPFKGYMLSCEDIIDYLSFVFDKIGFTNFVKMMNDREILYENQLIQIANQGNSNSIYPDLSLITVEKSNVHDAFDEIFNIWDKVDLFSIEDYLKDTYNNCEKLSLEFNINSKVTDKNKKAIFKDVTNLSLGQKVVAMLDFILAYSELTDDNRPLLIDQPEDNLDSRYIFNNLVKILRDVKSNRQIIIATHNATIVTNALSDLVILMKSNGEHGWIENSGYPSEDKIKKYIVDYLEGGIESFKHKVKIYKSII